MNSNFDKNNPFFTIVSCMNNVLGKGEFVHSFMCIFYTLYGIHKSYPALEDDNGNLIFEYGDDNLAKELEDVASNEPAYPILFKLYKELMSGYSENFEDSYKSNLPEFIHLYFISQGISKGEIYTPIGITRLMSLFITESKCKTVYDPFCGSASIVLFFDKISFVGQDINKESVLLARLYMDLQYGNDAGIICADSITSWDSNQYDAVVSVPPYGYRIPRLNDELKKEFGKDSVSLEEIIFKRAFELNKSKFVILFEPMSICYSKEHLGLRKYLINNNYLDSIITFPSNILYSTSIPCVMLVCKRKRNTGNHINIYDAGEYCTNDHNKVSFYIGDSEALFNDIVAQNAICQTAYYSDIYKYDFNLYPALYSFDATTYERGQQLVQLGDILLKPKSTSSKESSSGWITPERFSRDFMEILRNKDLPLTTDYSDSKVSSRVYSTEGNKKYLLCIGRTLADAKFALYCGKDDFQCSNLVQVYEINKDLVEYDYLIYQLINNVVLRKIYMPIPSCKVVPLVIDSIQFQIQEMSWKKSEFIQHAQAEVEADKKRLEVKENVSDLEHMLGTPQFKISRIIDRLEKMKPDSDNYKPTIKSLRDNMNYLNRMIKYHSSNIEASTLNPVEGSISEFVSSYANAWGNYGGDYFKLIVKDHLSGNLSLKFDKDMMTVLLDAVLDNASRHGFHKNAKYTENNQVEITLSAKIYQGNPYVNISIANNGEPIKEGFGINEYISRGRYDSSTGRSGLGGYHVYQITKKHQGYLYLDSTQGWSVIIDILLPVETKDINNFTEYVHECI